MSAGGILADVRRAGGALTLVDGRLRYQGPRIDEALRADIATERVDLVAELNGWRRSPDRRGWVETPERARRCVFNDGVLATDNPILCVNHRYIIEEVAP